MNRLTHALRQRVWRELSRSPQRPAVLRELFKRLTKAQRQSGERSNTGGRDERNK
jgi:hypothetical protein